MTGALTAIEPTAAQGCDPRTPSIQFAREDLQRAATEGDLPTALDYADRARREFLHLADLARRCGCLEATSTLEGAAKQIRPAQEAESRRALRDVIAATKPLYDSAMAQLQNCSRR